MNILRMQTAPESVLLSLTSQFLGPTSTKELALLNFCECLGGLGFLKPEGSYPSDRTVLKVAIVAERDLPPHSSGPAHSLHSSEPFPLWGPHHRCHRSCHCSREQWDTQKPNSHCTTAPAAGSAPLRSGSSLEGQQAVTEETLKALGPARSQQEQQSTSFLPSNWRAATLN